MRKATYRLFLLLVCLAALACRTAPTHHYYLLNAEVMEHAAPSGPSVAVSLPATIFVVTPLLLPMRFRRKTRPPAGW